MHKTRRKFLHTSLLLGAGSAFLAACGDDDAMTPDTGGGGGDAGPTPDTSATVDTGASTCTSTAGTISGNHGHAVEVSAADVAAGTDMTYDIQGTSGHAHNLTVTAADFAILAGGTGVTIESSTGGGHTHTIMVTCA